MRLSIIVPVYNVENYLAKCLDSLLAQDIPATDYEIIVIDDGSMDVSLSIAKNYAKNARNMKIISQTNHGLGGARNAGIIHATGNYLMFVDSDDFIEPNCLSCIIRHAETLNLDILRFNHRDIDEQYKIIQKSKNATHAVVIEKDVIDGKTFLTQRLGWTCYVCVYLFKTSLIKDGKLFFKDQIYFEDTEWLPRILVEADRVSSLDKVVYNYFRRTNSITKGIGRQKMEKLLKDKMLQIQYIKEFNVVVKDDTVGDWCDGLIALITLGILSWTPKELPDLLDSVLSELNKRKVFPLLIHKRFTPKQKIHIFLANVNPSLYCLLRSHL